MQQFLLKKWYLDVVTEEGLTLICYAATMTWLGMKVNYVSYLSLSPEGESVSESRFSDAKEPLINEHSITWTDDGFDIAGEWIGRCESVQAMLHDSEEGYLRWTCHQPIASVSVQHKKKKCVGSGYVECLEMTIPPWKMHFSELRWGRFAHASFPLVWIDLRGEPNRTWIFSGKQKLEGNLVADEGLVLSEQVTTLNLTNSTIIEDTQKIMETVRSLVKWLPGFDLFTPVKFLMARETKWRSWGTLHLQDHTQLEGWVVHELVKF